MKLKPCPFCGHPAVRERVHPLLPNGRRDTLYRVRCVLRECRASTADWYPRSAAIEAWNRRTNDKERLRRAILVFCREQQWAHETWKRQPHIAELFAIAKEAKP